HAQVRATRHGVEEPRVRGRRSERLPADDLLGTILVASRVPRSTVSLNEDISRVEWLPRPRSTLAPFLTHCLRQMLRLRGVDDMLENGLGKTLAAGLVTLVTLGVPVTSSAQGRYDGDRDRRADRCDNRGNRRVTYARPMVYDRYRARDSYYGDRIRD